MCRPVYLVSVVSCISVVLLACYYRAVIVITVLCAVLFWDDDATRGFSVKLMYPTNAARISILVANGVLLHVIRGDNSK